MHRVESFYVTCKTIRPLPWKKQSCEWIAKNSEGNRPIDWWEKCQMFNAISPRFFVLFDWCNSLPREFQFFFLVGTLNGYSHTCRFERAFCEIFVHSKRFFLFLLVCNTQKNGCENGLVTVMMLLWWYANWQLIDKITGFSETQVSYTLRFEAWWASKKLRFQC